jgi:hypothetical protein
MDKLDATGQNLGRVFNSRLGRAGICCAISYITKRPNLKLKTQPKELLGSLPLAFALPALTMTQMERILFASRHPITVLACLSCTYFQKFANVVLVFRNLTMNIFLLLFRLEMKELFLKTSMLVLRISTSSSNKLCHLAESQLVKCHFADI